MWQLPGSSKLSAEGLLRLLVCAAAAAAAAGPQLGEDVLRQVVQLSRQPVEQWRQLLAVGQHGCRVPQLVKEWVRHGLIGCVPLLGRVLQQPRHLRLTHTHQILMRQVAGMPIRQAAEFMTINVIAHDACMERLLRQTRHDGCPNSGKANRKQQKHHTPCSPGQWHPAACAC